MIAICVRACVILHLSDDNNRLDEDRFRRRRQQNIFLWVVKFLKQGIEIHFQKEEAS